MAELIKVENGMTILDMEAQRQIVAFELQMKAIKAKEDELRRRIIEEMEAKRIIEEMEAKRIIKLESEDLSITYKAAYDREKFSAKRLKQDHPDLYDEYVTITTVKPSILIKVR